MPTDVALIDLLPAILHQAGGEFADQGVEHEGWVLQRLGKAPFDENRTPEELDLKDGETVHLRPRASELPEIDFDDLVDGIADQAKMRRDNWTDRYSRWMLLAFGGVALLVGLGTLLLPGPALARTLFAALVALALLLAATIVSRSTGDGITATVLSGASVPYAAVCGWMLPVAVEPATGVGPSLACALIFAIVALVLGMLGTAEAALLFVGGLFATAVAAVTAVIGAVAPFAPHQAAAIGVVLSVVILGFVPTTSFRLAKLSLPALPTGVDDFGEDTDPFPYREVVERSAVANSYMTALYLSLGSVLLVLITFVLAHPALWTMIMTGVLGVVLLLRSRHISGGVQRWAHLVPGGYALGGDLLLLAAGADPFVRMLFITSGTLLLGALLVVAARLLPGKKLRPYWGRAVDIVEMLTAVALLPLLLAVLDTYMWVRGLAG
ncbi:hypothetical protein GCM10020366_52950 [Saccharopolyspora gregorii]|uniref:EccD-like transmembrane domain-containing protein n=1 Tax=Saccharopolyspora gregorii TaxID=33914 RepID=A0ABP6RXW4_9PSEU